MGAMDKNRVEQEKELENQKIVEFYSATINGWLQTRMEKDKSLLTLAAGAIGLLVTLLTAFKTTTVSHLVLLTLAIFFFTISLGCLIAIFQVNGNYLKDLKLGISNSNKKWLNVLDCSTLLTFGLGVILSVIAAFLFGLQQVQSTASVKNSTNNSIVKNTSICNCGQAFIDSTHQNGKDSTNKNTVITSVTTDTICKTPK